MGGSEAAGIMEPPKLLEVFLLGGYDGHLTCVLLRVSASQPDPLGVGRSSKGLG